MLPKFSTLTPLAVPPTSTSSRPPEPWPTLTPSTTPLSSTTPWTRPAPLSSAPAPTVVTPMSPVCSRAPAWSETVAPETSVSPPASPLDNTSTKPPLATDRPLTAPESSTSPRSTPAPDRRPPKSTVAPMGDAAGQDILDAATGNGGGGRGPARADEQRPVGHHHGAQRVDPRAGQDIRAADRRIGGHGTQHQGLAGHNRHVAQLQRRAAGDGDAGVDAARIQKVGGAGDVGRAAVRAAREVGDHPAARQRRAGQQGRRRKGLRPR